MFPNPLPCINTKWVRISWWPFSPPLVVEMINTNNGKVKMHAILLCLVDQRPIELRGCAKHVEPQHREHMEYDDMNRGVENINDI